MPEAHRLADSTETGIDLNEIIEAAHVGVFDLDLATGQSRVSAAWKALVGLPGDADICGQTVWLDRVHPDDLRKVKDADEAMLSGASERSVTTFRMRHEDGHYIWLQSNAGVSARDATGMPLRMTGVHIDVSDQMERERAKDEFVAMISHELRTPLTSVLGALKMANSGSLGDLPGPIGNMLELAQRNANRLLHLVNELLDFKSLESGTMSYEMTKIDATEAANDATASMEGYLQDGQSIKLISDDGDALFVEADVNRLQQILANLLSNAAKFSPADAEIEMGLSLDGDMVQFAVRDHGPGVPAELQGKMFQRFTQAKTGEKRKFKSTGLGLSICKQMTEGMGGQIGYLNNEDNGATFWVRFPAVSS